MRVVDLFCGCGGLSLGFQNAGFDIVAGFDNWKDAISIYSKNFSHPVFEQDLSDIEQSVSVISQYTPDMIIGVLHVKIFPLQVNAMKIMVEGD